MAKRINSAEPDDGKKQSAKVRPDLLNPQSLYHGVSSDISKQFENEQRKYLDGGVSAEGLLGDELQHDLAHDRGNWFLSQVFPK